MLHHACHARCSCRELCVLLGSTRLAFPSGQAAAALNAHHSQGSLRCLLLAVQRHVGPADSWEQNVHGLPTTTIALQGRVAVDVHRAQGPAWQRHPAQDCSTALTCTCRHNQRQIVQEDASVGVVAHDLQHRRCHGAVKVGSWRGSQGASPRDLLLAPCRATLDSPLQATWRFLHQVTCCSWRLAAYLIASRGGAPTARKSLSFISDTFHRPLISDASAARRVTKRRNSSGW